MRPMIWKELRENFKWAVLWMLGMGLAMAYALSSPGYYYSGNESICSASFLLVTTIGCALGAGLLGFLQVIMEMRRDQWAFLVHRPVTRNTIFAGKVVAGMILYLAATGIPLLIAAWWASTPGRIAAPFDGRMILPGLADILCGVVFYFAGMLTGLRQARWYASRALGIATAALCAILVTGSAEFWEALIAIVLIGTVMGLSAWGSFLTAGSYPSQPRIAKIALGLVVLAGIGVMGGFGGLIIGILAWQAPQSRTRYALDKDGRILRVTRDYLTVDEITDVDGNPIDKYKDDKYRDYQTLSENLLRSWEIGPAQLWWRGSYRSSNQYFTMLRQWAGTTWYYVAAEERIIGYSLRAKRIIGYISPDGFSTSAGNTSRRFEGKLRGRYFYEPAVFPFAKAVYEIDFAAKEVRRLFKAEQDQEIRVAVLLRGKPSGGDEGVSFVAISTSDDLHLLKEHGEPVFKVGFHYDLKRYWSVSLSMMPEGDRFFVWYRNPWNLPLAEQRETPTYLVELSGDGSVLNKHELPPLPFPIQSPWYAQAGSVLLPVGVLAVFGGHALLSPWLGEFGHDHFFETMAAQGVSVFTFCTLVLLSGVFCAVFTSYIARRYGFAKRRSIAWSLFSFFVGPVGILVFLALLDWPALEACASCGKKRVVDREQCTHCNASCPPRVMDGTEIFET